jgi:hypothetical protein
MATEAKGCFSATYTPELLDNLKRFPLVSDQTTFTSHLDIFELAYQPVSLEKDLIAKLDMLKPLLSLFFASETHG